MTGPDDAQALGEEVAGRETTSPSCGEPFDRAASGAEAFGVETVGPRAAASEPRWILVIPYKGAPRSKSRLADGFAERERADLARAFLRDVLRAARPVPAVARILVVTNSAADVGDGSDPCLDTAATSDDALVVSAVSEVTPSACGEMAPSADGTAAGSAPSNEVLASMSGRGVAARVEVVPDPGGGLNAAVRAGAAAAAQDDPEAWRAILTGDLPLLTSAELADGLRQASLHQRAVVPDAAGTGTTMLTVAPGLAVEPRFGAGSLAAHESLGHARIDLPESSTLRFDVDTPAELERAAARAELGPSTRTALRRTAAVGGA